MRMRNPSDHHEEKRSGSGKRVNENTYDISSIKRVTRKFLEISLCSRAKQRQRNVQQKLWCTYKVAFLLKTNCFFFHRSLCLRRLALHDSVYTLCLTLAKSIY